MATIAPSSQIVKEWLGPHAAPEQNMVRIIEAGLPTTVIARLRQGGFSRDEINMIINPRTLKHRRSKREPLSVEESDRVVRSVSIVSLAQSVFGNKEKAFHWLRTPNRCFEGRTPFNMLSTEAGGRLVEQMLVQIDEGMVA